VNIVADAVIVENLANHVAVVTINRPDKRNALTLEVKRQLSDHVEALGNDASTRVIVIAGAGGNFVAGTDIYEMSTLSPTDHVRLDTSKVFRTIASAQKPVIAAVEGYALGGGCELALACDMIVAAKGALFGQPEIGLGIIPGAGGMQRLLRAAGKYRTMKLVLTGEHFDAETAEQMGLVSELTEDGYAREAALRLADRIAKMPSLAVAAIKETMAAGQNMPLDAALILERKMFQNLFDSEDQKEGMRAFIERRKPVFTGK
jgi:enoyl-CoA hydratase